MVLRGGHLPRKLRADAIVEALLELQFESDTSPERLIGRIVDSGPWKALEQRNLPAHQVPSALRQLDPSIRYQPTVEIASVGAEPRALKVGPFVVSYHRAKTYVGWERFRPELEETVDILFAAAENLRVTRIGLRYLNAFNARQHGITSIADLDLAVSLAEGRLTSSVNANFLVDLGAMGKCGVRVATKDFVQGPVSAETTAYLDIDVFTNPGFECKSRDAAKQWISDAHTREKQEFFHLLTQRTIDALTED